MISAVDKCATARVIENARVGADGYVLRVGLATPAPLAIRAGQFYMLRDPRPGFPFLGRPFSVLDHRPAADRRSSELSFLFKVVGRGTAMLAELVTGGAVEIVGPLGNSWPAARGTVVCVAGGVGIPPLFLEIKQAIAGGASPRQFVLVYGARSRGQLYLHEAIEAMGVRTLFTTEDGSLGQSGRVDVALRQVLAEHDASPLTVHACGPHRMLEVVGEIAERAGRRCFLSLETFMGCGFGVCNACAVKVRDPSRPQGYKYERCCREGSIFEQARLLWT